MNIGLICLNFLQITIDFPEEYLVEVQGIMKSVLHENIITSLTFITNKQSYGPYGCESGRKFKTSQGLIVGFYGRASLTSLNQIGCIVKMFSPHGNESFSKANWSSYKLGKFDKNNTMNSNIVVIPQGPWGGWGGEKFYDGRVTS